MGCGASSAAAASSEPPSKPSTTADAPSKPTSTPDAKQAPHAAAPPDGESPKPDRRLIRGYSFVDMGAEQETPSTLAALAAEPTTSLPLAKEATSASLETEMAAQAADLPAPASTSAPPKQVQIAETSDSKKGGRGRTRRFTRENMISKKNLLAGTDESGVRIRIFTATLTGDHGERAGLAEFKYEGDSIESEEEGLKMAKFGQTPRRKRHGHGTITYKSGGHYVGQWAHDRREGHGVYTYACGDVYDGEWREGRYHGKGRYTSASGGDSYDGEWAADKPHGFGRYVYAGSGTVFEGRWEKGLREGAGKELLANGDVYEGRWEAGELISLSLTHEHLLAGTDESGVRISMFTATLTCLHSAKADLARFTYEGDSIESDRDNLRLPGRVRHGNGEIKYDSGNHYIGQWQNDKRDGVGTYTYACGDVYDGEWREGRYHGKGRYTSTAGGDSYDGEWAADKPYGFGRYSYSSTGEVYEGQWVDGERHGRGSLTDAAGVVLHDGEWSAGQAVKSD